MMTDEECRERIERIQQNPLVRDLNHFLVSVIEQSPERSRPAG